MLPSFYLRLIGYALLTAIVFGAGFKVADWRDTTKLEALQTAAETKRANGEEAARTALATQLVTAQAQQKVNSDAMQTLQAQNSAVAAERDTTLTRVRRLEQLLAGATRLASTGGQLPEAERGQDPPGASAQGGVTEAEGLLVAAANECELNDNAQDALVAEVLPKVNAL